MLTPEQYDQIADHLTGLFQDLEAFIIQDFVRRVTTAGTITETARYQIIKAEQMGLSTQAIKEALQQALNISESEINSLFKEWGLEAIRVENGIASQAGIDPITLETHPELEQIIGAAIDQTKGELVNMTGTLGFAQKINGKIVFTELSQYFQKEMDFVQMQVQSGVLDYNSAIRQSVKRMADSGLRTVDYASGWSNHLDVAVRRATLTGANQMSGQLTDALGEEMACNFVEVTAHAGARNTGSGPANHASWQGKVYARKGETPEYPNLAKVTGYGTGPGLKGWNCRHDYNNFWPGYSERTWTDEELANIDPPPFSYKGKEYDYYAANQRQRAIERAIRKTKRELIGYDAAGDKEAFTAASIKLQRQRQEYQSFSKAAGLRQKPERHQVYRFDRKIGQKATQARKKVVDKANQQYNKGSEEANVNAYQRDEQTRKKIREDYPKMILEGKQGKHLIGHNNYTKGKSYLTISLEEAQRLVDQYAGTGEIKRDSKEKWTHKEFITLDHVIGVVVDPETGKKTETRRCAIHYSNKGTHIVPAKEVENA